MDYKTWLGRTFHQLLTPGGFAPATTRAVLTAIHQHHEEHLDWEMKPQQVPPAAKQSKDGARRLQPRTQVCLVNLFRAQVAEVKEKAGWAVSLEEPWANKSECASVPEGAECYLLALFALIHSFVLMWEQLLPLADALLCAAAQR